MRIRNLFDPGSGILDGKKFGSAFRDKHPGSVTLLPCPYIPLVLDGTVLQRKTKSAGHLLAATGAATMGAATKGAAATTAAAKKRRPLEKRTLALIDENTRLGTQPVLGDP
jgi:hypothetical protein